MPITQQLRYTCIGVIECGHTFCLGMCTDAALLLDQHYIAFQGDGKEQCEEETVHMLHVGHLDCLTFDLGVIPTRGHYSLCHCYMFL